MGSNMNVTMVWAWMLRSSYGVEHECYYMVWAWMLWSSHGVEHECYYKVWAWMLWSSYGVEHECYYMVWAWMLWSSYGVERDVTMVWAWMLWSSYGECSWSALEHSFGMPWKMVLECSRGVLDLKRSWKCLLSARGTSLDLEHECLQHP